MKRMTHKHPSIVLVVSTILATCSSTPVWAHQPVMDMSPRWKGGYGFQVREEYHSSDTGGYTEFSCRARPSLDRGDGRS